MHFPNHSSKQWSCHSPSLRKPTLSMCSTASVGIYNLLPLVMFGKLSCLSNGVTEANRAGNYCFLFSGCLGGAPDTMRCSIRLSWVDRIPVLVLCKGAKAPRDSCCAVGLALGTKLWSSAGHTLLGVSTSAWERWPRTLNAPSGNVSLGWIGQHPDTRVKIPIIWAIYSQCPLAGNTG